MSSGNPFRASLSHHPASSSPVPQTSFINADSSVPEAREDGRPALEDAVAPPPKTKKHVRIESNTTFIPPHPAADSGDDSPSDTFSPRYAQSQDASFLQYNSPSTPLQTNLNAGDPNVSNTWPGSDKAAADMFSSPNRAFMAPQSAVSPSGVPANPFSRTLASMEPQERGSEEDKTTADKAAMAKNRASLDVESFKNLLMTGKPGPRHPGPQSQAQSNPPSGPQFESSSTDTSSISRSSVLDPPQELHADSPRTSYDMAESDEEERARIISDARKEKKKPPPTPKHRHGKLVTPRQPQTVSFDSFAASEPAASPITRPRDNSDATKPLPPTPITSPQPLRVDPLENPSEHPLPIEQKSNESLPPVDAPQPQKKLPPPVPLARRQSQLRSSSGGNRSRSNSSLTMSSQMSVDGNLPSPAPSIKDSAPSGKLPPPPPRSRHGARLTDGLASSANSSTTDLPQRSPSVRSTTAVPEPRSTRRSTLDPEQKSPPLSDLHRTSSVSSNRNTSRAVSGESTSSTMAPPPPPPRRRGGSGRSSLDQQRPTIAPVSPTGSRRESTEYRRVSTDSKRRTSVASESSLRHEYASASGLEEGKRMGEQPLYSPQEESEKTLVAGGQQRSDSNNILDDMEKFQREIDELRQRFKQAG